MIKGMDVSKWNGEGNFDLAKAQNVEFVLIRLGSIDEGTGIPYTDYLLEYNVAEAQRVKLPFGYWFYTRPRFGYKIQTDFIIKTLATLPKANIEFGIDVEQPGTSTLQAHNFAMNSYNALVAAGYPSLIYTRPSFWDVNVDPDPLWNNIKLWIARYNLSLTGPWSDGKFIPRDWTNWKFWQYDQSLDDGVGNQDAVLYGFPGTAGGGSVGLEKDYYNGTIEQFRAEYNLSDPITDLKNQISELGKQVQELSSKVNQIVTTLHSV